MFGRIGLSTRIQVNHVIIDRNCFSLSTFYHKICFMREYSLIAFLFQDFRIIFLNLRYVFCIKRSGNLAMKKVYQLFGAFFYVFFQFSP